MARDNESTRIDGGRVAMSFLQSRYRACTIDGRITFLRPKTAKILEILLMQHPDRWTSCNDIIEYVWPNPDFEPDSSDKCVHFYAADLRKAGVSVEGRRKSGGYRIPREARK